MANHVYLLERTGWEIFGLFEFIPRPLDARDDLADLKEHLRDLYEMFSAEDIPGIKKVEELEVA